MAAGFSFKMEGLDRLQKKLDALPKKLTTEVGGEIEAGARNIERNAKIQVPVDTGRLKNAISAYKAGPITWEVVAQTNYAAYVEFGTGTAVRVPSGLEDYAMQFKGSNRAFANLPARPFLFNNYLRERPEIIKRLKAIIGNLK